MFPNISIKGKDIASFVALLILALVCARISFRYLPIDPLPALSQGLNWISASQAKKFNALWVDARPYNEYQKSHVPGAISVNLQNYDDGFQEFASVWRPDKLVTVYCDGGGCGLSAEVAARLKKSIPSAKIFVLEGGFSEWQKE